MIEHYRYMRRHTAYNLRETSAYIETLLRRLGEEQAEYTRLTELLAHYDRKIAELERFDRLAADIDALNLRKEALYEEYMAAVNRDRLELAEELEGKLREVDAELSEMITEYIRKERLDDVKNNDNKTE